MTGEFDTRFYVGAVSHRRLQPVSHRFSYKIFSMLINIDELPQLDAASKWFAYNRPGLVSFMDKDHGPKDGSPLRPWIEQKLKEGGEDFDLGAVRLLCFPRLFGLVFNPLSIWYCYDTNNQMRAILYEVRNTFKEWCGYLLPVTRAPGDNTSIVRQACDKAFYVSPLMNMDCRYNFTLSEPGEKLVIGIRETEAGKRTLLAAQTGAAVPFDDKNLKKVFLSHPLMFFKVVAAIHWEAFRTLLKGAKFNFNPRSKSGDVLYPERETPNQPRL